jgi:hypothetical protein
MNSNIILASENNNNYVFLHNGERIEVYAPNSITAWERVKEKTKGKNNVTTNTN